MSRIIYNKKGAVSTMEHGVLIVLVMAAIAATQQIIGWGGNKHFMNHTRTISNKPFDPSPGNVSSDLNSNNSGTTSEMTTQLSRRRAPMIIGEADATMVDGLGMGLTNVPGGGVFGAPLWEDSKGDWFSNSTGRSSVCDDKGGGC